MNDYYLKIFLREKTNVLEYLKLSEYLKTQGLVEETYIGLDNPVVLENYLQDSFLCEPYRKYKKMMKKSASFKKRRGKD